MPVKICAVNSKFIHSNLAVHSLACYFKKFCENIELAVCEFTVNDVYKNVLFSILADKPEIIAFSVYIWNVGFINKLCGDIKKIAPEIKIILGGPEVSFGAPFDCDIFDYIIAGEGERAFFCLVNEIYGNDVSDYKEKFGYKYKIDEKRVSCGEINNLGEIPFVYTQDNINLFKDRIIYYESSRGCPFSCSYCLSAQSRYVRCLPVERVYIDIDFFIREESVGQVKFVDRTFNGDKNRAYAIFEYIINNAGKNKNFHFEICADLLDERVINLLSEADGGLIQFEIGIQTTNKKTLEICARKTDINKCFENIKLLLKNKNINIHVNLIAGLPEDTLEDFKDAFNQVYNLKAHQFQLGFLKLLKGAPLNQQVGKYGYEFSAYPPYEILGNNSMAHEDLLVLHRAAASLDKFYNSGKFEKSLDYCIGFFDSPFDFYLSLANYMLSRDCLYRACSPENLFDTLAGFAALHDININLLKESLLIDYHSRDIYDRPPGILRDIWLPHKNYKNIGKDARKAGDKYYFFDYSEKNPVTDKYNIIKIL